MKTELTDSTKTESIKVLIKMEASIEIITIKAKSPFCKSFFNQKYEIIPVIPDIIMMPQKLSNDVITFVTFNKGKNLLRIPNVVLAPSINDYPVTAITITVL
jgi:hypothetical protein